MMFPILQGLGLIPDDASTVDVRVCVNCEDVGTCGGHVFRQSPADGVFYTSQIDWFPFCSSRISWLARFWVTLVSCKDVALG